MNHRARFDEALRALPSFRVAYLARLAHELDRRAEMDDRTHLLYSVLAEAAPGIEPMLDVPDAANVVIAFLLREAERIAAVLYAPTYLTDRSAALAPFAVLLKAELAAVILDRLAKGQLTPPKRRVWRIRSDQDAAAFPYDEADGEG